MKHSPADILRHCLTSVGLCTDPPDNNDWPGFSNFLADSKKDSVLFTDTNGVKDGRYMYNGKTVEHPGVQILVRGDSQTVAWQRIDMISKVCDAIVRQQVVVDTNTYLLLAVHRRGSIIPLSTEEHYKALERQTKEVKLRNFIFVLNLILSLETDSNYIRLPGVVAPPPLNPFWGTQNPIGSLNGINTVFTIVPITADVVILTIDGVIVTGYTISGSSITFTTAPTGSVMVLTYIGE